MAGASNSNDRRTGHKLDFDDVVLLNLHERVGFVIDAISIRIIHNVDCVRLRKASGARLRHRRAIVEAGRATTHTDVQTRKRIIPEAVAAKGNRAIRLGTKHAVRHGVALIQPVHTYMPLTEYLAVLAIPKLAISGNAAGTISVSKGAWFPSKKQHAGHWVTSTYLARPPAHGKQLRTLVSKVPRPLKLVM